MREDRPEVVRGEVMGGVMVLDTDTDTEEGTMEWLDGGVRLLF